MDFLNIKDQNDQNLIDFLADLAMRDSLHDFGTGEVGNFINSNQPQFLEASLIKYSLMTSQCSLKF